MSLAAARAVLKVERSSSGEDVKKAYKKLALKHHPDKGGSADEFRKVNEAMEMCMDHLYEPASFSRSGLAAPDRRPGAGETSWADVKVYWTPGARGFGPMPMPYGPPPPLTRLPLAYFRDLLAGRVREAALAETADLDYLIVDARSEDERTATGEATLSSLGDIRLRVAIATLPPEACLDGSGDVVLPWVHTLADWANRKEARRLSETAKAALRAAESANDRGALVVVVSQTGSAIKHDRGDDEVAAEFLRNAQVLLAPAREGVDRTRSANRVKAPRVLEGGFAKWRRDLAGAAGAAPRERWRVKSGGAIARADVAMDSPVVCELRPGEIVALAELDDASPRVATSACGKQRCKIILPIVGWITLSRVELPGAQRAGTLPPDLWGAYAPRRRPDAEPLQWEKNAARRFGATSALDLRRKRETRETAADLRERARAAAEPPKPPPKKQWWETATPAEEEKWEPAPRAGQDKRAKFPTSKPHISARRAPPPVAPDLDDDDPIEMPPLASPFVPSSPASSPRATAPAPRARPTPSSAPPPHSSSDSDEPAPPAPKQRSTSRWAIHKPEGWVPKSQRTPEAASPPPRKQKHPISPQATTPVPPRSFAAFMKSRKPGETPTTPKSRTVRLLESDRKRRPESLASQIVVAGAYTMASKIPTWAGAASFAVPIAVAYAADKASSRCETCLAVELGILCHLLHRLARVAAAPEGVLGEFGPLCAALAAIFFKPAWESTSTIAAVTLVGALLAAEVWRAGFADGSAREGAHDTWLTLCGAAWTYALYESPVAALLVLLPLCTIIRQDLVESINELKPVALRFGVVPGGLAAYMAATGGLVPTATALAAGVGAPELRGRAAALVAAAAFRLKKRGASALYQNVALAQLVVVPGAYALVAEPDFAFAAVVAVAVAGAVVATELLDVAESKSDVLLVLALALVLVGPALQTSAIFGGAAPVAKPAAYQAKTTTTYAPPPPPPPEPEAAYAQAPQSGEDDDDDE
ncbi:hypothetical protein SO694_000402116 [Aureococcus anophagefferens]|uniref:J domain-containing protein n=1 Tax=Aureococcus anophagefferens TaxID=44056 RepID=A0ABR1G6J7_AURAN